MHIRINKKVFSNIDYSIVISTIIIIIAGIITIKSATKNSSTQQNLYLTQAAWFIISCIAGFIVLNIDYNTIGGLYKVLYAASIIMLILVLIAGKRINGAKSWLGIGPLGIQPAEFAKLTTIITLAKIMEDMENINTIKNYIKIGVVALVPMILIQLEPDTGTNLIFAVTILGMLFIAGLNIKIIYSIFGTICSAVLILFLTLELNVSFIKKLIPIGEHGWNRLNTFFHPELDTLGTGYNAYYVKTAIGSGKFFGMGYNNGILSTGKFIPECQTDFIFSVYSEQWGFLGSVLLLLLYFNLIYKSIQIAKESKDNFGKYLIVGIITMITFQIMQNIGMDIGLLPITGIPLPMLSYGGSSLLTNVVSIALILNVGSRRKKIDFSGS